MQNEFIGEDIGEFTEILRKEVIEKDSKNEWEAQEAWQQHDREGYNAGDTRSDATTGKSLLSASCTTLLLI